MLILLTLFTTGNVMAQIAPRERSLPPSLQRELKLRQGKTPRIVSFTDTVKAQTLISRSIRDSSARELDSTNVGDSAVVVIDSSVSLSRKELLDSMLAELPEYEITPSGGRFKYPPEILVETAKKTVPFDTTIYSHIEPVSRELLPYFDALPLPLPIAPRETKRFVIDAGVGVPSVPSVGVEWMFVSSDKTLATLFGNYLNRVGEVGVLKSHIHVGVEANTLFANDNVTILPHLSGKIQTGSTRRLLITPNDSSSRAVANTNAEITFSVGDTKQLRLESMAHVNLFHEEAFGGVSEPSGKLGFSLIKDIDSTASRFVCNALYQGAGSISDTAASLSLWRADIAYHHFNIAPFEWSIGAKVSGGSDASDSQTSFLPIAEITFRPNDELSFGAAFAPQEQLMTLSSLLKRNLFYALPLNNKLTNDPRRITTDNINVAAFASYFLSSDENIRGEVRFITRKNEVIFDKTIDSATKRTLFVTSAHDTRRIEAEIGARLLFFGSDQLAATLHFTSATSSHNNKALLYEPIFRVEASWAFHSVLEKLVPRLELVSIARKDRSLAFINAELHYPLTRFAKIKLRAENLFGGAGDFWDGYNEYPRSILISIRAGF